MPYSVLVYSPPPPTPHPSTPNGGIKKKLKLK